MSNLLSLEEAAALLKMTPAQLKSMQERGEIFPVRGGSGLQFKRDEVERFADDQGIEIAGSAKPIEDELSLGDEDYGLDDPGSDVEGATGGFGSGELSLDDEDAGGIDSPSALELAGAEEAPKAGSSLHLDASDLELAEAASKASNESALDLSDDDDFAIAGEDLDDDASVLSPSDSGVKLNPDDSGLSLEASGLDLDEGGSGALAMDASPSGVDSEIVSLDDADPFSQSSATELKGSQAGDFDLASPADVEEDEESGSQVIALDEGEYADAGDATLLGGGFDADLGGDQGGFGFEGADGGMGGMGGGMGGPAPAGVTVVTVPVQEKPYSIWSVIGLMLVLMFMAPGLIFMTDLLLNMWDYDGDYLISQSVVDSIVSALQLGP